MTQKIHKVEQTIKISRLSNGRIILVLLALLLSCGNAVAQLHIKDGCSIKWLEGTKVNNAGKSLIYDSRSRKLKATGHKYKARATKKIVSQEITENKKPRSRFAFSSKYCFRHEPFNRRTGFSTGSKSSEACVETTHHQKLYVVATKHINIPVHLNSKAINESNINLSNSTDYHTAQIIRPPPPALPEISSKKTFTNKKLSIN
jgi:hypothetical protein